MIGPNFGTNYIPHVYGNSTTFNEPEHTLSNSDFFLWIQGVLDTHPEGLSAQAVGAVKEKVDEILAEDIRNKFLKEAELARQATTFYPAATSSGYVTVTGTAATSNDIVWLCNSK